MGLSAFQRGVRRYWLSYFKNHGARLTDSQVARCMELHGNGYTPDVAVRMVQSEQREREAKEKAAKP